MNDDQWEAHVREVSQKMVYPPTPDLVRRVLKPSPVRHPVRRVAVVAALVVLIMLGVIVSVPPVRAAVEEWLDIGVVQLAPGSLPTTATLLPSLLDLPNQTTLDHARESVDFSIKMPTYPSDLGEPDVVFVSPGTAQVVTLVWLHEGQILMSLHLYAADAFVIKGYSGQGDWTAVKDEPAIWLTEPHLYQEFYDEQPDVPNLTRYIDQDVLIWVERDNITYRLETTLSLYEALKVANSVK